MILALALIATFVATYMTGPAGQEWLAERRAHRVRLLEPPRATVHYLPSAACREQAERIDAVDVLDV